MFSKDGDGVTHILVSCDGTTALGKALSLYCKRAFKVDGTPFTSFIGYYMWVLTGMDYFKIMHGRPTIKDTMMSNSDMLSGQCDLTEVINDYFNHPLNASVKQQIRESTLPFVYYDVVPTKTENNPLGWYINALEAYRQSIKGS